MARVCCPPIGRLQGPAVGAFGSFPCPLPPGIGSAAFTSRPLSGSGSVGVCYLRDLRPGLMRFQWSIRDLSQFVLISPWEISQADLSSTTTNRRLCHRSISACDHQTSSANKWDLIGARGGQNGAIRMFQR